jgi:hypothetical protein
MALKKNYLTTSKDTTNVIKASAYGLIFNTLIYNHGINNANIKYFLTDSNDNEIIIYEGTLSSGERLFIDEKYSLEGEDIKIYSSEDDVQIVVQILDNN